MPLQRSSIPGLQRSLPPITLIPCQSQGTVAPSRTTETQPTDLRWMVAEEFLKARSLSPSSKRTYEQELKRFLAWTDQPLRVVNHRTIAHYKAYLSQEFTYTDAHGNPQRLSKATINKALATVKSFFRWLHTTEQIERNPTQGVSLEKLPLGEAQDLSAEQAAALWQVLVQRGETQGRDLALIAVLSHGLRASEVCGLNVGDYDGVRVYVREAKDDSTGTVPLCREAREQVDAYLQWRQEQEGTLAQEDPLFLSASRNNQGNRLTYSGLHNIVKGWGAAAGIPDLHPHQFRHSYATGLLLQGLDSLSAKTLTRHRSLASLERYAKRAKAVAAERAFFAAIGESAPEAEQGRGGPSFLSQALETPASAPADSNLEPEQKTATVILWLRVEHNNKFIRKKKKVREQIEQLYLSAYQMKHLDGWEYELTIPYTSDLNLNEQIEELLGEMSSLADNHCCFIEVDVSEVGGSRSC